MGEGDLYECKKWICMSLVPAAVIGLLAGCGNTAGGGASSEGTKTVKVGTLSGPIQRFWRK